MTEAEWLASESPEAMLRYLSRSLRGDAAPNYDPNGNLAGRVGERKLRLFGEACSWASGCSADVVEDVSRRRFLDATVPEWARRWTESVPNTASGSVPQTMKAAILRDIVGNPFRPVYWSDDPKRHSEPIVVGAARSPHPSTVPHVEIRRSWLTPDVLALAEATYSERQPDGTLDPLRLAILADTLEDGGCPTEVKREVVRHPLAGKGRRELCRRGCCVECADCSRKPGAPTLCRPCLEIREACAKVPDAQPHPLLAHLRSPEPHWRGCWALDLVLGKS